MMLTLFNRSWYSLRSSSRFCSESNSMIQFLGSKFYDQIKWSSKKLCDLAALVLLRFCFGGRHKNKCLAKCNLVSLTYAKHCSRPVNLRRFIAHLGHRTSSKAGPLNWHMFTGLSLLFGVRMLGQHTVVYIFTVYIYRAHLLSIFRVLILDA